ncbi:CBS domain-containing protein [Cryomorphaceae bacterium S-15]|uniref:CBS domain-containing protein n=2 Tax=Acidiluteibacter ferrifornacis TaxID=2692424 RepID=A0A6N9NHC0_9FLAO|nr:chloride channel protein [bacterium]NBG64590.1 CBS domain-containing protein [Acidiluteibacter ferrifornacis]
MSNRKLITRILLWRRRKINTKQWIMILSIVVGFAAGISAVIMKNLVHLVQSLLTHSFVKDYHNYLYFIYPIVGIFLTLIFIKYILKQKVGHGIPSTLYAISTKRSIIARYNMYASVVASVLTVGFGGSVGLEGPAVSTSSAIGSNIGRLGKVNYKATTLLLGCGAAGAMAGIFNAPIAAIVFALEVIMLDLTAGSLIPLLLASVSAALTSRFIAGDSVLFNVEITEFFKLSDTPYFVLLGVFSGLVSVYFSKVYWSIEARFDRIKSPFQRLWIGGVILGGLIFFIPPLYGEGFLTINELLTGNYINIFDGSVFFEYRENLIVAIGLLFLMMAFKAMATAVTFGAGGVGGIFAPSLFLGSTAGFVFAKILNYFNFINVSEKNFILVGMGGLLAGVLHAPLTALFLIAEITASYELITPLMLTAATSFLTAKYFVPHSLYTMQLAKRGELITHDKDKAVLTLMKLHSEVEMDFKTVLPEMTLGELVKVVAKSHRNIFPVLDEDGMLVGIVLLDDIRKIMFDPSLYDSITVADVMSDFPDCVSSMDTMDSVMSKFQKTGAWNLPVIDNKKYVGFVSKSKLFNAYRKILMDFSE